MKQTTNYKFNKPELTDLPDITQLNHNFDTIDAELKAHDDEIEELGEALGGKAATSHSHTIGDLPLASVAEAKAGSIDTKVMTPAKAKESALAFGMSTKSTNPITSTANDTPVKWKEVGAGTYYFNKDGYLINQPSAFGFLINYVFGDDIFQLWKNQASGDLCYRSGNASGWGEQWKKCAIGDDLEDYLPLAGGELDGELFLNRHSINSVGRIEFLPIIDSNHGGYLDFHFAGDNSVDYTSRIIEGASGRLDVTAKNGVTLNGNPVITSAGGTITGPLRRASSNIAACTTDNSHVAICGGTDHAHGSRIVLSGKDYKDWNGELQLQAHDGTNVNTVRILPDGNVFTAKGTVLTSEGGKLTGGLNLNDVGILNHHKDATYEFTSLYAIGNNAPGIELFTNTSATNASGFNVRARGVNGEYYDLGGRNDGSLQWGGKNIVRSVNGVSANAAGNVALKAVITETWSSGYSWYRKWSDGWIEQGGQVTSSAGSEHRDTIITFHKEFSTTNISCFLQHHYTAAVGLPQARNTQVVKAITQTNATVIIYPTQQVSLFWQAVGY